MLLYVFRHGEARTQSEDPERGLTAAGRAQVAAVSRVFAKTRPEIREIWHSDKARAEQTGAVLADTLRIPERMHMRPGLHPNDPVHPLVESLRQRDANLVIVGHLPHLSRLVSVLLTGTERTLVELPAAGLLCLQRSSAEWRLDWFLTPDFC